MQGIIGDHMLLWSGKFQENPWDLLKIIEDHRRFMFSAMNYHRILGQPTAKHVSPGLKPRFDMCFSTL